MIPTINFKKMFLGGLLIGSFIKPIFCEQYHRPRILVKDYEKSEVLAKINRFSWARVAYENLISEVEKLVEKHKSEPEWILSRFQLNWQKPFYTNYSWRYVQKTPTVSTLGLQAATGSWSWPTVRANDRLISDPLDVYPKNDGMSSIYNTLEPVESLAYICDEKIQWLSIYGTNGLYDPAYMAMQINETILRKANIAAFLYWLTGEYKYGKFAADIVVFFGRSLYPVQYDSNSSVNSGYIGDVSLYLSKYDEFPQAYDFMYKWLHNGGDVTILEGNSRTTGEGKIKYHPVTRACKAEYIDWIETSIVKLGYAALKLGWRANNWNVVDMPLLVSCALAQSDPEITDRFMTYFLYDGYDGGGGAGMDPVAVFVPRNFSSDGLWQEPFSYHNYPVPYILKASYISERNGFPAMSLFPAMVKSSFVLEKYLFPNGQTSTIGDAGGPSTVSVGNIEISLRFAEDKLDNAMYNELGTYLNHYINKGNSRGGGVAGLCWNVGMVRTTANTIIKNRSDQIDLYKMFIQRNGNDEEYGLMYTIQGQWYPHGQADAMHMNLYGCGHVLGPDPGRGSSYTSEEYAIYYSQFAAHNMVIAGSQTQSLTATQTKQYYYPHNSIEKIASDPEPNKVPLHQNISFTDLTWFDGSTDTRQRRVTFLIRNTIKSGYYFDIYRSDNSEKNEYIYHNIGDSVNLLSSNEFLIPMASAEAELNEVNPGSSGLPDGWFTGPGISYFKNKKQSGLYTNEVRALFPISKADTKGNIFMKMIIPGELNRNYFTVDAPRTWGAPGLYNQVDSVTPTTIIRGTGECWTKPFLVLYEPYRGEKNNHVNSVNRLLKHNDLVAVQINSHENRTDFQQILLVSTNSSITYSNVNGITFSGNTGVVGFENKNLSYLFLGDGNHLSKSGYVIKSVNSENISANIFISNNIVFCSTHHFVRVTIPVTNVDFKHTLDNYKLIATTESGLTFNLQEQSVAYDYNNTNIVLYSGILPAKSYNVLLGIVPHETHEVGLTQGASYITPLINGMKIFSINSSKIFLYETDTLSFEIRSPRPIENEKVTIFLNSEKLLENEWRIASLETGVTQIYFTKGFPGFGKITIQIINSFNIISSDDYYIIKQELPISINCWPNPIKINENNNLHYTFNFSKEITVTSFGIYSMNGNVVYQNDFIREIDLKTKINIWDLRDYNGKYISPGLYFLVVVTDDGTVSEKIIVQ